MKEYNEIENYLNGNLFFLNLVLVFTKEWRKYIELNGNIKVVNYINK